MIFLSGCYISDSMINNHNTNIIQDNENIKTYDLWNDTGYISGLDDSILETVNCYRNDNKTIGEALSKLESGDIYICRGMYNEDLFVDNKDVNLYATNAILTNIKLSSITIIDSNVNIDGLIFQNSIADIGSVLNIINSNVNIYDSVVRNNYSNRANIYVLSSEVNIFDTGIYSNTAVNGSAFLLEDSTLHIFNSEISDNHSDDGAILFDKNTSSNLTFKNIIWNSGEPLFNPIDSNTDYDIYFSNNWGYRFDIFDPEKFFCSNSEDTYPENWPYSGICSN